jgi:hypothetical protein
MRKAIEIYNEAKKEVIDSGNQSSNSIAILSIEKAQLETFYFLYKEANKVENRKLSLVEFFDNLDKRLIFINA